MSQNLDKNKIRDSIQKARPQDLLYLTINPADKNSKKNVIAEVDRFIGKASYEIFIKRIY
jgi:uncharacterized protein (DUF2344 family)